METRTCSLCGATILATMEATHRRVAHGIAEASGKGVGVGSLLAVGPSSAVKRPPEVMAVAGLFALVGVLSAIPVLQVLPDLFEGLFSGQDFVRAVAAVVAIFVAVLGFFAASCLAIAWMLWNADRAGRVFAVAFCAVYAFGVATGEQVQTELKFGVVAAIGAIGVLTLAPQARAWFTGPHARYRSEPTTVVVARTVALTLAGLIGFIGMMYLIIGQVSVKFALYGVLLIGGAIAAGVLTQQLRSTARNAAIAVGSIYGCVALVMLISAESGIGAYMTAAFASIVPALIFGPTESREYFGLNAVVVSPQAPPTPASPPSTLPIPTMAPPQQTAIVAPPWSASSLESPSPERIDIHDPWSMALDGRDGSTIAVSGRAPLSINIGVSGRPDVTVAGRCVIGRAPRSIVPGEPVVKVTSLDGSVSASHLLLEWTQEGWNATDLGSTNGTTRIRSGVNSDLVAHSPMSIESGDAIMIGDVRLDIR